MVARFALRVSCIRVVLCSKKRATDNTEYTDISRNDTELLIFVIAAYMVFDIFNTIKNHFYFLIVIIFHREFSGFQCLQCYT